MKIAILTLPLINNYGGILQAYAMSRVLENLGHEAVLLNLKIKPLSKFSLLYIKFLIVKTFIKKYKNAKFIALKQDESARKFIDENLPLSIEIYTSQSLKNYLKKGAFEAVIVGSDQVLRPSFFGFFKDDFSLSFLDEKVKKVLYAGSFGGSFYDGKNKEFHARNFAKFRAISVREKGGVRVFEETFGLKPSFVLDPTLLAKKEILEELVIRNFTKSEGKILSYILDKSDFKDEILQKSVKKLKKEIFLIDEGENRVGINEWVSAFFRADTVITDSFHGCVFSIIFNKPFFVFINESRGSERFNSLFELFELEDRVIKNIDDINLEKRINWQRVNEILSEKREISMNFLIPNLKADL